MGKSEKPHRQNNTYIVRRCKNNKKTTRLSLHENPFVFSPSRRHQSPAKPANRNMMGITKMQNPIITIVRMP